MHRPTVTQRYPSTGLPVWLTLGLAKAPQPKPPGAHVAPRSFIEIWNQGYSFNRLRAIREVVYSQSANLELEIPTSPSRRLDDCRAQAVFPDFKPMPRNCGGETLNFELRPLAPECASAPPLRSPSFTGVEREIAPNKSQSKPIKPCSGKCTGQCGDICPCSAKDRPKSLPPKPVLLPQPENVISARHGIHP